MYKFNHCRNTYKANVLLLLLINYLLYSIDIATKQGFRYKEPTDAKSEFPNMHHYARFLQIIFICNM